MSNAVFTYSPSSEYDDQPEVRYHFPKTYLRVAEHAVGDWILYYEPRRTEGAFGRAVRTIPSPEFDYIVAQGFARELQPWEVTDRANDPVPELEDRPMVAQVVNRPFRDAAFRRHVRDAYRNTCAVTGLCLLNGGGRPEVQAAHIRSVEANGPDTVRNGLALTATVHWMFDRGLISVDDSLRLLVASKGIPGELASLVQPGKVLGVPTRRDLRPHATYLRWHREECFKG
ncbi:MAG: HNH endonuclease [Steroidobacteraceae bacterium]|nr:HNH endonuclease [Steroidobacteraceae bacterium]MCW5571618.1 HNH endonuclease [Steroidobacteraceae bacterium]